MTKVKHNAFVNTPPLTLKGDPGKILLSDTRHDFDATSKVRRHPAGKPVLMANARNACPALDGLHTRGPRNAFQSLSPLRVSVPVVSSPVASPTFFQGDASSRFFRIDRNSGKPCRADGSADLPQARQELLGELVSYLEDKNRFACAAGRIGQFGRDHVFSFCEHPVDSPEAAAQMREDIDKYMLYQSEKLRQGNLFPSLIFVFPNDDSSKAKAPVEHPRLVHLNEDMVKLYNNLFGEIKKLEDTEGRSDFERRFLLDLLYAGSERAGRRSPCTIVGVFAQDQFDRAAETLQLNALRKASNRREKQISGSEVTPKQPAIDFPLTEKQLKQEIGYILDSAQFIADEPDDMSVYRLMELYKLYRPWMKQEERAVVTPVITRNFGMALAHLNRVLQLEADHGKLEADESVFMHNDLQLWEMIRNVHVDASSQEQADQFYAEIIHGCLDEVKRMSGLACKIAQISAVAGDLISDDLAIRLLASPRKRKRADAEPSPGTTQEDVRHAMALLRRPVADADNLNPEEETEAELREVLLDDKERTGFGHNLRIPLAMPALRQRILDDMDADTRTAIEDLLRAELDGSAGTGSEREEMPPVTDA